MVCIILRYLSNHRPNLIVFYSTLVADLIWILISLVDGLLIHITPLLGDIIVAINALGLSVFIKIFL